MPGKWRVYDRNQSETVPVYDDAPHGNDKPLVFTEEDSAIDFVATMNNNTNEN